MADIWDQIAEDVGANTHNLAATSVLRQKRNPALVARARRLSAKYGVPSPIIEQQPEVYEAQDRKDEAEAIFDTHPWMVPVLAEDPDVAKLFGKEDLPRIGDISRVFGFTKPEELTFDLKPISFPPGRVPAAPPAPARPSYGQRVLTTTGVVLGTAVNQIIGGASGAVENVTDIVGLDEELDPFFRSLEAAQQKANESLMNEASGWITPGVKRGAFSAAVSLTQLGATAGLGGAGAVLPLLTGITYGNAYQKYQGRGVGTGMSMVGAGLEGGLEYATERLPVGYLTSKLGKGTVKDFFTHVVLGETLGEQIATAGQSLTEAMIAPEQPTTFKEWLLDPARGQEAWETLVASTLMTGAIGGANLAANRLNKVADTAVDATDALIGQSILDDVMARAEKVEMRTTAPEEFAKFINEGAKGSPVKNVYIPVEAIDAALADETLDEEDRAALTLYQDQIEEARVNNGEVVIPIGDAAATFAGTKVWQTLREDARVLAGGISGREAKEQMKTIVDEMENIGNQTIEEARAAVPKLVDKATIYNEVKAQVMAAGRSEKEAQTTAVLLSSRAETLASERYGKFKTPQEAWEWMKLRIVGADTKVPKGKKVAQLAPGEALRGLPQRVLVDDKEVEFGPLERARQVAANIAKKLGIEHKPPETYAEVDPERAARIAQAFEEMQHDPTNPEVKASYDAMIKETIAQYKELMKTGLKVEFIEGEDPYGNPRNAILDVVENNHLWVYPTDAGFGSSDADVSGNPLLEIVPGIKISGKPVRANDLFRVVHDYFGHIMEGTGFRARGEENAWRIHSAMYSPLARRAMTTETRGQNSWVNFGPYGMSNRTASPANTIYADQKIGLLPEWVSEEGVSDEQVVVNIGLAVNDGSEITPEEAVTALEEQGVKVIAQELGQSTTEPTLIATLSHPLTEKQATAVSSALRQDAIAQRVGNRGEIYGPAADKWRPFNPDFFLSPVAFSQSDLTEAEKPAALPAALETARSKQWPNMRDFKMAIQRSVKKATGNLRDPKRLISLALADARLALQTNANAVGWYNDKMVHALETLAVIHPEISTDNNAKFAFIYALAVTSNGMEVSANFRLANTVYELYKKTGKMPIIGEGNSTKVMQASFSHFNNLVEKMGIEGLRDFMTRETTVKEIENTLGIPVSGEHKSTRVLGAAFLGPKIGNGYFANLYGNYNQLTMDRWFMRTWGRWTGSLITEDKAKVKAGREKVGALLRSLTPAERRQVGKILSTARDPYTVKLSDIDGFAKRIAVMTSKASVRAQLEAIHPRLRLDPKNLWKDLDGQKEAPANGGERNEIRSVMMAVYEELRRDNPDLTMADLQAVLWYPEKTLYDASKAKVGQLTAVGYENDEAPDYANAAVALARSQGISEEKINAATKRADARLAATKRAGRAGRAADGGELRRAAATIPEDANGFPLEEGLSSVGDGTHDPMVLQQFGGRVGAANVSGRISKMYRAMDMEEAGATPEKIWTRTGWMRGQDGLWRFEIDDSAAYIHDMPSGEAVSLNDVTPGIDYDYSQPTMGASSEDGSLIYIGERLETVLHHPALFKHYPQLRGIGVFVIPLGQRAGGYFDGFNVVVNSDQDVQKQQTTILHELQHAIQSIEGFTNGAAPDLKYFESLGILHEYERILAWYTSINDGNVPGWTFPTYRNPQQLAEAAAYETYARVLGEVEARNTQLRAHLDATERRQTFPDLTADRPPEQRIVPMVEPMRLAAQSTKPPTTPPTKTPRGEATFYPDGRTVVQLFGRADFSTMLHEMSHVFLQQEFTLAKEPGASEQLKADVASLTKWFEANGGALDKNGMPNVEAHELFARTGERYFREGKAPSAELRSAFKQFKTWLTGVYTSVKDLLAFGPAPINPEIREIMDRMIATTDAIELNATAPLSQQELGMTDSEYSAYLESVQGARDDGWDILLERMMSAIRRRETKKGREHRANVRAEVADEINAQPRFIALHLLRTGRWLGDPSREATPIKLNTGWLIDNYGEEILARLPVGLQPLHRGDGVVGDVVAEMVGMGSGNELVEALVEMKIMADELKANGNPRPLRDTLIEQETDARLALQNGDIMTEEQIEEEAIAALNANRQGEVLATELRQLKKIKGKPGVVTPYQLLREWARRKINESTVDESISKATLQRYIRAYNKARNLFEEAILGGKSDEAIKQKQAQMINHALLAEGKIAADEINTIVRRMHRYSRTKAMSSIDQDYMDRIHELLEGYNFRTVSDRARADKASFEAWAEGQRALGHEVYVPARFRDDRMNWKDAKVAKLLELNDMVLSLVSQGKLKQRLTSAAAERELRETLDDAESRILSLPPMKQADSSTGLEQRPFRQRLKEAKTFGEHVRAVTDLFRPAIKTREAAAGLLKIEGLMDILDGTKDGTGPLNQSVIQPATEAANTFSRLLEEVMDPIIARYRGMSRKHSARLRDFVTINELTLNVSIHEADQDRLGKPLVIPRMKLLGLILNTGNLSNLAKLVGGERWGDPESATDLARVRDILVSYASKEDMDLVQDIWNGIGKMWPHIARVERELSGIVPEEVVPMPFETRHGPYSGGYWPVVWDSTRSEMGKKQGEEAETSLQGVGFGIATPKGHTITRTGAMAPMEWSLEHVLFSHTTKVLARIAYAPWVRDTLKIIDNPRITGAIRLRLGGEYVKAIKPWIRDQIPSNMQDVQGAKSWEKFLDQVRVNMSIAVLGISYTTGVAQALGLGYSAGALGEGSVRAGGQWVARGMYETIKLMKNGALGAQEFVFSRSEEMQRRAHEINQEAAEVFRRLKDHDSLYRRMQAASFWHIGFIDINMVAIPTWLGGYHKALGEGKTEEEAVHYAEKMVRLSQSSGRKKDLSAIQRGNAGQKFIAMFYTPSSVFFNQQWEAAQHLKAGNWSKALAPTFWFLVMTTLADAMREGDWPEDEDEDGLGGMDIAEWVGRNLMFGLFYGIPVARDVANTTERKIRGEYAEYGTTPLSSLATTVERGAKSGTKMVQGEEIEGKDIKNQVSAMGFLLGLPGNQLGKSAGFVKDVYDGKVEADSAYDWYHGIVYGKPPVEQE